ncbi:MAG: ATP-binding cassette domain-containing protein, partial [Pirellula sp.]
MTPSSLYEQGTDLGMLDSDAPLVELQHASLMYGTVLGVNDIHLGLPRGAYALVGPNGAGKSTLIGLITGSLRPTLGQVKVFGKNPCRSRQVLRQIG